MDEPAAHDKGQCAKPQTMDSKTNASKSANNSVIITSFTR